MKTTQLDLPSKGYFYPEDHPLADGTIEVKHMTAADEDILTDQNLIKQGVVMERLLQSVIVTDVPVDNILSGDKGGILLATRILAYGPNYTFEVDCPVCGEKNRKSVDLQEIESKDLDLEELGVEPHQTEFFTKLPASGSTIGFKLLTHGDTQQIDTELKRVKRTSKSRGPQVTTGITTRLRYLITSVEGEDSKAEIRRFVEQMPARDSLHLRNKIKKLNPDLDLNYEFICDYCGHLEEIRIPIDDTFFFPTE
jgi:hypothetical protein